jgi:DNA-binding NarL/FixJ family response regulator
MIFQIAIVDDKFQNRASLSDKLATFKEFKIVFTASNGQEFLNMMKELNPADRPKLVLMDIDMPVMDGIEAVEKGSGLFPDTKYLMLTVFDDDEKIFEAIKAGALGYLLKDEKVELIAESIKEIMESGGSPMSPRIARKALKMLMNSNIQFEKEKEDEYLLTEREKDILKLMVEGYDYKSAAEKLFISPHTVRKHIANIYEKLHVTSKVQAVKVAMKKKWF